MAAAGLQILQTVDDRGRSSTAVLRASENIGIKRVREKTFFFLPLFFCVDLIDILYH